MEKASAIQVDIKLRKLLKVLDSAKPLEGADITQLIKSYKRNNDSGVEDDSKATFPEIDFDKGIFKIPEYIDTTNLSSLLPPGKLNLFLELENLIIPFCIVNGIHLYNLSLVRTEEAKNLLIRLVDIFNEPFQWFVEEEPLAHWRGSVFDWTRSFYTTLALYSNVTKDLHAGAFLSVGEQFQKQNGEVLFDTLLTKEDMVDLFNDEGYRPSIESSWKRSNPFAYEEISFSEPLSTAASEVCNLAKQDADLFLPITIDGHWVYLQRKAGEWSIHDSQPFGAEFQYTPRQFGIEKATINFLSELYEKLGCEKFNADKLDYFDGNQQFDFECGTLVVNAWRKLVDKSYHDKTHTEMLIELCKKQTGVREENINIVNKLKAKLSEPNKDNGSSSALSGYSTTTTTTSELSTARRDTQSNSLSDSAVPNKNSSTSTLSTQTSNLRSQAAAPTNSTGGVTNPRTSPATNSGFQTAIPRTMTEDERRLRQRLLCLDDALVELFNKAKEFEDKAKNPDPNFNENEKREYDEKYRGAATAAYQLHQDISRELTTYRNVLDKHGINDTSYLAYTDFKQKTEGFIKEQKTELGHHRELGKKILLNIVGIIMGLGVFYLAYMAGDSLYNAAKGRGFTPTMFKTEARQKLDSIMDCIYEVDPSLGG